MSVNTIRIFFIAFLTLLLCSCQGVKLPDVSQDIPAILYISQGGGSDFAELEVAVLRPGMVRTCGFYIESTGTGKPAKYVMASLRETRTDGTGNIIGIFGAFASQLETDCDYSVRACISNGINEIYSNPIMFRTTTDSGDGRPGNGYTDLSADGCANCYIVPKEGYYSFRAKTKGCSTEALSAKATKAGILWESYGTGTKPEVGSIVRDAAIDDSGTLSFYATGRNGNAVIAALDADGRILWSWHIWACQGYDPMKTCATYAGNSGTMMDRNLGATSTQAGTVEALGLMYQWGRKDPFPGSSSVNDSIVAQTSVIWPTPVLSSPETIRMADIEAIPMTYIKGSIKQNGRVRYIKDAFWSGIKGKNDPCPPGWRVPDGGPANIWALAGSFSGVGYSREMWSNSLYGADPGKVFGAQTGCWYPAVGYYNMSNVLKTVGKYGVYWTCTPSAGEEEDIADAYSVSGSMLKIINDNMSCACAVRCCKE